MARVPIEREQDLSWETEFDSELEPETEENPRFEERPRLEERPRFEERPRLEERPRFEERLRFEERPRLDERRRPEQPAVESHGIEDFGSESFGAESFGTESFSSESFSSESYGTDRRDTAPLDTKPERRSVPLWPEYAAPKIERGTRAVYPALLVVLAFAAVWMLGRDDVTGPPTGERTQATNEAPTPEPLPPATREPDAVVPNSDERVPPDDRVASRELADSPSAQRLPDTPAKQPDLRPVAPTQPSPGNKSLRPGGGSSSRSVPTPAPSPTVGPRVTTSAGSTAAPRSSDTGRQTRPAPPERRPNIEPPARPPYRSIPEPDASRATTIAPAAPVRAATPPPAQATTSQPPAQAATTPSSSRITPSPSGQVTTAPSPGQAATSPSPPRTAVAESTAAPRVAVDEPTLRPPMTPAPQPAAPEPVATPPTAAARPPAASSTPAPAAPAAADDSVSIRDVLGRYRNAFNALDARAASEVWPTVNERNLDRAFGQLEEQSLSFDRCTIAIKGVLAEANCSGTTRFVPRVGSRSGQTAQRQWNFSLRKVAKAGWLIQDVEAR